MRAREFIFESKPMKSADGDAFPESHMEAIPGPISMPDLSLFSSEGSGYKGWRFGIALAGAPHYPTPPVGAMAGEPLLTCYTDVDEETIVAAAKFVGAGKINRLGKRSSEEHKDVHRVSPVKGFKGY